VKHVLTLVAEALGREELMAAVTALRRIGVRPGPMDWLAAGRACDLPFTHPEPAAVAEAVREGLASAPVDLAVQPTEGRRKRLLLADMESTVIANEMLDELADFAGARERVAEITARAMNGELDFRAALRERVGLLRGLPSMVLLKVRQRIRIDPGAKMLVATVRHHDGYAALVSGGFGVFAEPVRERLGFDEQRSNELMVEGGRLTGELGEPILDKDAKLSILEELCGKLELTPAEVAAVGDGANDLPMLRAAGLGVAYRGKPKVQAAAPHRVEHGDLRVLLYFQGYRAVDIRSE
jgi:phosphoserine phosphatase